MFDSKRSVASAMLLLGATLAGCSGQDADQVAAEPSSAPTQTSVVSSTSAAPAGPATSARGAIVKSFDQDAGLGCYPDDAAKPCDVEFTIALPQTPNGCSTQYAPENGGQLVALPVSVQTGLDFDPTYYGGMWNAGNFSVVRSNGVTLPRLATSAAYSCDESDSSIPNEMSPASQYEGYVVLDVPEDATTILFKPPFSSGGWEWELAPAE